MNWYKIANTAEISLSEMLKRKFGDEFVENMDEQTMLELEEELKNNGFSVERKGNDIFASPFKNGTLLYSWDSFYNELDKFLGNKENKWIKNFFNKMDKFLTVGPGHDISKDFTGGIGTQQ